MEEKRSFIFDVAWIKRGVAKALPDKIKVDEQELKEIIQGWCYFCFYKIQFSIYR
jgi:hypothetical protein